MHFTDRSDAGRRLAGQLAPFANHPNLLILALPRGGVPVAFEIARSLHAPLDVWVVRKIGAPQIPEFALGAIAPGGMEMIDPISARQMRTTPEQIRAIIDRERAELERREGAYRGSRPPIDVTGKTVIVVDDGLATGSTMRAAVAALRQRDPARIVVAAPVAASSVCTRLADEADEVVCLWTPPDLESVGQWYQDFSQTSDEEVCELLNRAEEFAPGAP